MAAWVLFFEYASGPLKMHVHNQPSVYPGTAKFAAPNLLPANKYLNKARTGVAVVFLFSFTKTTTTTIRC